MTEHKRQRADTLVKQINIEHDFDKYLKEELTKARNSLGLPNIATKDLLRMLRENKQDKLYNKLKTLINFREIYYSKKEYIQTQIK